ncbi:MAG: hypothetical protein ABI398_04010 [Devosia sp.]
MLGYLSGATLRMPPRARISFSATLLSLAFLLFPFSFALQVTFRSELLGATPYLFIALSLIFAIISNQNNIFATHRRRLSTNDMLVISVFISSFCIILSQIVFDNVSFLESARSIIIFVSPIWIYIFVSSNKSTDDINAILFSIVISSLIVAVFWIIETYTKSVLGHINWFELQTFDYIKYRNNYDDSGVNASVIAPYYRAYGLQDRYTTTGAIVAIGSLAVITIWSKIRFELKISVLLFTILILYLGMATLSLITFVILVPFVAVLLRNFRKIPQTIAQTALLAAIILPAALLVLKFIPVTNQLLDFSKGVANVQVSYVTNVDGTSAAISWFEIFRDAGYNYVSYFADHPWRALFGEGFTNTTTGIQKGSDVALFEFFATYGIVWVALFMLFALRSAWAALVVIYRNHTGKIRTAELTFGLVSIAFILMTLIHYNTLFNKSVFALLFLGLGVIERNLRLGSHRDQNSEISDDN